jgi:hypothetical protein
MTKINYALRRAALGIGAIAALTTVAGAQTTTVSATRWQAWVGCWQRVQEIPRGEALIQVVRPPDAPTVCIAPGTTASSVDIITVDSSKVISRYAVDASGASQAVNRDGCVGSETARWSHDSLRVFLRSDVTCANSLKRLSTGIMSIASGEWIDAQGITVAGNEAVRTVRYQQTSAPKGLPADLSTTIATARRLDAETATLAAGAPLTPGAIAEAAHAVDTAAVQAWLVERHEPMKIDAKTLMTLADAGVPGSVTDVMVALANPEQFHFAHAQSMGEGMGPAGLTRGDSARIAANYDWQRGVNCDGFSSYSPYGWGIDPCESYRYGYRYGSGYGYGYGYNAYGYGGLGYGGFGYGYPGYYYSGPVVIVQNSASHGRAVNGQGYTRGGSSSSAGASTTRSSDGSSSASSGSSSSSSGSGSSSSGRTAHAKPPAHEK